MKERRQWQEDNKSGSHSFDSLIQISSRILVGLWMIQLTQTHVSRDKERGGGGEADRYIGIVPSFLRSWDKNKDCVKYYKRMHRAREGTSV